MLGGGPGTKPAAQPLPRAWRLIDSWADAPPLAPRWPGHRLGSRRRTYVRLAGTPVTALCSQRHRSGRKEVPFSSDGAGQIAILCLLASPPARLLHDDKIGAARPLKQDAEALQHRPPQSYPGGRGGSPRPLKPNHLQLGTQQLSPREGSVHGPPFPFYLPNRGHLLFSIDFSNISFINFRVKGRGGEREKYQ